MFAQPANSGIMAAVAAELEIPDPTEKTVAELLNDARPDADCGESSQSSLP